VGAQIKRKALFLTESRGKGAKINQYGVKRKEGKAKSDPKVKRSYGQTKRRETLLPIQKGRENRGRSGAGDREKGHALIAGGGEPCWEEKKKKSLCQGGGNIKTPASRGNNVKGRGELNFTQKRYTKWGARLAKGGVKTEGKGRDLYNQRRTGLWGKIRKKGI